LFLDRVQQPDRPADDHRFAPEREATDKHVAIFRGVVAFDAVSFGDGDWFGLFESLQFRHTPAGLSGHWQLAVPDRATADVAARPFRASPPHPWVAAHVADAKQQLSAVEGHRYSRCHSIARSRVAAARASAPARAPARARAPAPPGRIPAGEWELAAAIEAVRMLELRSAEASDALIAARLQLEEDRAAAEALSV
jgi:hypothetical protein